MHAYIKNIKINLWVVDTLLNRFQDRLGDFITFELVKHPTHPKGDFDMPNCLIYAQWLEDKFIREAKEMEKKPE